MNTVPRAALGMLACLASFTTSNAAAGQPAAVGSTAKENYIILYQKNEVPADLAMGIGRAGGTLVNSFAPIGVAIAQSADPSFAGNIEKDARVERACSTGQYGFQVSSFKASRDFGVGAAARAIDGSSSSSDPLEALQWDMRQIHVPEAHGVTAGDRSVLVGDIDTGLDYTHPDLAPNVDFASSCSCLGGVPNQSPAAWDDDNGHGTHTAGTIAAAANGIGIVGIAPNVRIAAIKAGNSDGFFFPEAVICAFMWAAEHHFDVVNNSYFADPWEFNCRQDAQQHAIWKAEQRAIRYAIAQGVTVVASLGNDNLDLAHPTVDSISPDWPPGTAVEREVNNACAVIPAEIPGVIGVAADGSRLQRAFYSNYGVGVTQVTAPGGDAWFQFVDDGATYGFVLSTIPRKFAHPEWGDILDPNDPKAAYGAWSGTSMAAPHVTGVAALIISRYGKLPPGKVQALINRTADPLDCPPNPFDPCADSCPECGCAATCQGGPGYNSFYGHGQVNAFQSVIQRVGK